MGMDVECLACRSRFTVDDGMVPPQGAQFPCPTCGTLVDAVWPKIEIDLDESELEPTTGADRGRGMETIPLAEEPQLGAPVELDELEPPPVLADPRVDVPAATGSNHPWVDAGGAGESEGVPSMGFATAVSPDVGSPPSPSVNLDGQDAKIELGSGPNDGIDPDRAVSTNASSADGIGERLSANESIGSFARGAPGADKETIAGQSPADIQTNRAGAAPLTAKSPSRASSLPQVGRAGVAVVIASPQPRTAWRFYLAVGSTAGLAILLVVLISALRRTEPPPPQMPNPLREYVEAWVAQGVRTTVSTVEGGVRTARAGLEGGTDAGLRQARAAVRSALIHDVDAPGAIAAYGLVLAHWPDRLDPELSVAALGAIASAIGESPEGVYRADLEEARAWLLVRQEQFEAARKAAERALALKPGWAPYRMAHAVAGIHRRVPEAVVELEALRSAPQAPVRLPRWLGEAYLRAGDASRALEVWSSSLGSGADIEVRRRLARLAIDLGDMRGAMQRLDEIAEHQAASVGDRLLTARILSRVQNKSRAALEVLDAGLTESNNSDLDRARLMSEKVAVATRSRELHIGEAEVSRWLNRALDLAPDLPELLYIAGMVDQHFDPDSAVELLSAAHEQAPERPEAAMVLAWLLRETPGEARPVLSAALKESPQHVPLHLVNAVLELDRGNGTSAASSIRRALDFDPARSQTPILDPFPIPVDTYKDIARAFTQHARGRENAMLVSAASMAHFFAGDVQRANALAGRALRLDANEVGARLYRSVIALERNRLAAARRDLGVALAADSQHRIVRLYHARVLETDKKTISQAERIYRDLLAANPLDRGARIGLARVLRARGAADEARREALSVLAVQPRDRAALSFFVDPVPSSAKRGR